MLITRRAFLRRLAAALGIALIARRRSLAQPPTLIIDGHLDLGWNIVNYGRDYTRSALELRWESAGKAIERVAGKCMVGLPELLRGGVAVLKGAIFVIPRRLRRSGLQIASYQTSAEAAQWGWRMLDEIEALAARSEYFTLVRNVAELEAALATWQPDSPEGARRIGIIPAMEGADPIETPGHLGQWHERGLRCLGLSWGRTRYAGGNTEPSGLTDPGRQLLREMRGLGVILDVAHLAEQAFWDMLDVWQGSFVYTHGNARRFVQSQRALSDDQIKALAARNGVMGIGLYNGFFQLHRADRAGVTITDVVNAIDYVCQLLGTCEHIALGSDLDGGFGAENAPAGIDTIADLQLLPHALRARGFAESHVNLIMHGNWLRFLRENLPA